MSKNPKALDLEGISLGHRTGAASQLRKSPDSIAAHPPVAIHFEDGLVDHFHLKKPRSIQDLLISGFGHAVILALIILIPLCYSSAIDMPQFEKTYLIAPPLPPPPPPPPMSVHATRPHIKSFLDNNKLFAPKFIPKQIAQTKEEPLKPEPSFGGMMGGVPGGVPGGQLEGALGGILGGTYKIVPPPPPKNIQHVGPYRVGGKVQAPLLVRQVQPIYPILAKQAHVQGDIQIDCVIDEHGNVTQMKVVSGNPLLVRAAFNAVEQWKYQPTLLNGSPVPVAMVVTVHFTLAG